MNGLKTAKHFQISMFILKYKSFVSFICQSVLHFKYFIGFTVLILFPKIAKTEFTFQSNREFSFIWHGKSKGDPDRDLAIYNKLHVYYD